ncbi:MAG: ABC transporter permease [Actinobacteria bacterium]|nr:ABC transporter permease [Actinomycetota bacterium]
MTGRPTQVTEDQSTQVDPTELEELTPAVEVGEGELPRSLWRVRLRLAWQGFRKNWRLFAENKIGLAGLIIILIFAVMALAFPLLRAVGPWDNDAIYDPVIGYDAPVAELEVVPTRAEVTDPTQQIDAIDAQLWCFGALPGDTCRIPQQPAPPSEGHLLGTDPLGRDIASQLTFSTRAAFLLGLIAALVTVGIATSIGSIAAFYGGWLDNFLMRFADLILLMPLIPILIVMSGLWEINLPLLGVLIGVLNGFGGTAIVLKSQALSVKVKPFIDAARVSGGSNMHLIFRHIVPNVLPLSFLYMMFSVTEAVSLEATLSFFGLLNVDMSWGIMLNTAQSQGYLRSGFEFWWLLIPAGVAVTLLAAGFFFAGRAMDEVINPRLRAR